MKVFISWSGSRSKAAAEALRSWLPKVIQAVEPFMSSGDILAGSRGERVIASELAETDFGIVCVTAENQREPWVNFEAGALAKLPQGHVVPIGIDLAPADIERPLGQFQARTISREDLREVVVSLNAACSPSIPTSILDETFDRWWPDIEQGLKSARRLPQARESVAERSYDDKLDEVLETVRALANHAPDRSPTTGRDSFIEDLEGILKRSERDSFIEDLEGILGRSNSVNAYKVKSDNYPLVVLSASARLPADIEHELEALARGYGVGLAIENSSGGKEVG